MSDEPRGLPRRRGGLFPALHAAATPLRASHPSNPRALASVNDRPCWTARLGPPRRAAPGCPAASPCGSTRSPHRGSGGPGGCPCAGGGTCRGWDWAGLGLDWGLSWTLQVGVHRGAVGGPRFECRGTAAGRGARPAAAAAPPLLPPRTTRLFAAAASAAVAATAAAAVTAAATATFLNSEPGVNSKARGRGGRARAPVGGDPLDGVPLDREHAAVRERVLQPLGRLEGFVGQLPAGRGGAGVGWVFIWSRGTDAATQEDLCAPWSTPPNPPNGACGPAPATRPKARSGGSSNPPQTPSNPP